MEKLKPCPFCGNQEFVTVVRSLNVVVAWVDCNNCGCYGPAENTEAEAIAAWNHREGEQYEATESK